MGKYQVILTYENHSFEEILQINADSAEKAKLKCEEIKQQNQDLIERLKNKNIYISKKIKDCICKVDWREELIESIDKKLKLENDI